MSSHVSDHLPEFDEQQCQKQMETEKFLFPIAIFRYLTMIAIVLVAFNPLIGYVIDIPLICAMILLYCILFIPSYMYYDFGLVGTQACKGVSWIKEYNRLAVWIHFALFPVSLLTLPSSMKPYRLRLLPILISVLFVLIYKYLARPHEGLYIMKSPMEAHLGNVNHEYKKIPVSDLSRDPFDAFFFDAIVFVGGLMVSYVTSRKSD